MSVFVQNRRIEYLYIKYVYFIRTIMVGSTGARTFNQGKERKSDDHHLTDRKLPCIAARV